MIISRSNQPTQILIALLKDSAGQGIRAFGNSSQVIAYLQQHPDQEFLLEPSMNGRLLDSETQPTDEISAENIFTGRVRFDSHDNRVVYS